MNQAFYQTGEFAGRSGVTARTLRYYDKIGLLRPSAVSASGYRLYTDRDLLNLQQILALKFLGFSLGQIREFLAATPGDVQDSLQAQEELMTIWWP